jgi:hypothetical protein
MLTPLLTEVEYLFLVHLPQQHLETGGKLALLAGRFGDVGVGTLELH